MSDPPTMYSEIAGWWPLLSAPAEYAEEACFYRETLEAACAMPPREVLELGSGGGNNASHLQRHWRMTLVDRSPGMLAVSRRLNPECEHVEGDMRSVRLERQFDAVFVHDAIGYMTTAADLQAAMLTAFVHCAPGAATLFAPDATRESFRPSTSHGGHDGEGRGLRYLQWTRAPDPGATMYVTDYAYLLHEPDGTVRSVTDHHVLGLFPRSTWLALLEDVGFVADVVDWTHSEAGPMTVFTAKKPG